jgi:hypothetical protein
LSKSYAAIFASKIRDLVHSTAFRGFVTSRRFSARPARTVRFISYRKASYKLKTPDF